ncbi:MAG: potassium channel protein [Candidatus Aminicenantes bacterium]|nr:potassium channel protein [Candidatus Aminicenantes bacterium]
MNSKRRLLLSVLIFFLVFFIGIVGFKFFGGGEWSFLDSLYMTIITISTVGYKEVIDLSANPGARIFVVAFIILSLGTITFAISSITAFIVEGELKNILWRRKMEKKISKLKDHYIVCGADETARSIIDELILTKRKFVLIGPSQEKIDRLLSSGGFLYLIGDSTEDEILLSAGIKRAKGIILSLPKDEENLFVTLSARSLNPRIRIVSKAVDLKSEKKMRKAGADSVISPTHIGGMRMVSEMVRPAVVTFLDMMLRDREKVLRFEEVCVEEDSGFIGRKLGECRIKEKSGALLVAVRDKNTGDYHFNPPGDTVIKANDILIFIASPEMIEQLEKKI